MARGPIKFSKALEHSLRKDVSGPQICPGPQASARGASSAHSLRDAGCAGRTSPTQQHCG